jgi:hypothetical protein
VETECREHRYTVARPVLETSAREEHYTVMRPVCEMAEREERYLVQRPVVQTCYSVQYHTVMSPVVSQQTQMVDHGCFAQQTVFKPAWFNTRLAWLGASCAVDPATGRTVYQRAGLYWVPTNRGRYEVRRVWQPNVVAEQTQHVCYVPQTVAEQIPVQVSSMRTEEVCRKVPYQICRMVPQDCVRQVPVQTCRMTYEERVERVPYQTCRMVAYQETVRVPHCVEKRIPVTYTCTVPHVVCYREPIGECCEAPGPAVAPAPAACPGCAVLGAPVPATAPGQAVAPGGPSGDGANVPPALGPQLQERRLPPSEPAPTPAQPKPSADTTPANVESTSFTEPADDLLPIRPRPVI